MVLTVKEIYFDDVQLPTPGLGGLTITTNKIWSANTGRLETTGEMVGTIVTKKRKVEIKWPALKMEDVSVIEEIVSSVSNPFHTLKYVDMTGKVNEIQVYFGDPTYTIYSYSQGVQRVTDVVISAIEK